MTALSLSQLAEFAGGTLTGDGSHVVSKLSKDTRTLQPGDVYIALRGDNFDGNAFAKDAVSAGAVAVILDVEAPANLPSGTAVIRVEDTLAALHRIAACYRDSLDLKVCGITGSSGKTSTKEFTAAVFAERYQVTKTLGNLNNHIGLPLTILSAKETDQFAVWEMGMNHAGEIAPLAALARPDIGIITTIGVAHIEFFEDRSGIANEKAELLRAIPASGVAIIPGGDDFADYLAGQTRARVVRVGLDAGEVRAENVRLGHAGSEFDLIGGGASCPARLRVPGVHMIRNALLAVAAGLESGLSLEECASGLESARLASGRLELLEINGVRILDDSYNANPDSMEAALATLAGARAGGRGIAVLGRMGELGSYAETGYHRVATAAARYADVLIAVGPETRVMAGEARAAGCAEVVEVDEPAQAADRLREIVKPGDIVLVKGSRAARMERVIGGFKN